MAWVHFTSYLDGSRPIKKAERDELYSQLATKIDQCAEGFEINATTQATINASGFLTDRVCLNSVTQRLVSALAAISGSYPNFATVVSNALAAEGITSTQRDAIISASVDSHHLWNYYKRVIDGLLCPVDAPTLKKRTASASKSKCGWSGYVEEWSATPPAIPKRYRRRTFSGTQTADDTGNCAAPDSRWGSVSYTWSGYISYSDVTCAIATWTAKGTCVVSGYDHEFTGVENQTCEDEYPKVMAVPAWLSAEPSTYNETEAVWGSTSMCGGDTILNTCCTLGAPSSMTVSGALIETVSDEYTTAQLVANVDTALAAASWGAWSEFGNAFYDLIESQFTATKRKMEYYFEIPAESGCYKLTWKERFTPPDGGEVVDTPKSYLWDGAATETSVYSVDAPTVPGTISIVDIVATPDCS